MDRFGSDFGALGDGDDHAASDDTRLDEDGHEDVSVPPPSPVGQDERRMQVRAYNYWVGQLGDHELPHIESLEPECLPDFGPNSVLLDFSTGRETPAIPFIGSRLQDECRTQDAIETLDDIPADSLLAQVADTYLKVLAAQAPVTFDAESVNAKGRCVAYRGVLLPYSSDNETIDFVFAVVNWKEVADARTADALLEEIDAALASKDSSVVPFVQPGIAAINGPATTIKADADIDNTVCDAAWNSPSVLGFADASDASQDQTSTIPAPTFGQAEEEPQVTAQFPPASFQPGTAASGHEADTDLPRRNRGVDALGNPVGTGGADRDDEDASASPITTAAEYGLPEWDEEEPEEDVDDLVNPLADIDLNSRLLSLVNSGSRSKKTVDLATLTETLQGEEGDDDAGEERALFKPKAPPVDTLLTPQAYDEDEDGYQDDGHEDRVEKAADEPGLEDLALSDEPAYERIVLTDVEETPESEAVDVLADADAPVDTQDDEVDGQVGVFEIPSLSATSDAAEKEIFAHIVESSKAIGSADDLEESTDASYDAGEGSVETAVDAPDELLLDVSDIVEEDEPSYSAQPLDTIVSTLEISELVEDDWPEETADAGETHDTAVPARDVEETCLDTAQAEPDAADLPEAPTEPALETVDIGADEAGQDETLHGLLAAVNDLAKAASTTRDTGRRALYEAVGRAFDASIKAVIASEPDASATTATVTPLPVGDLAPTGPELSLVMIRRHRNGETEIVGEVPHDEDLLDRAQHSLASRSAGFGT